MNRPHLFNFDLKFEVLYGFSILYVFLQANNI